MNVILSSWSTAFLDVNVTNGAIVAIDDIAAISAVGAVVMSLSSYWPLSQLNWCHCRK